MSINYECPVHGERAKVCICPTETAEDKWLGWFCIAMLVLMGVLFVLACIAGDGMSGYPGGI